MESRITSLDKQLTSMLRYDFAEKKIYPYQKSADLRLMERSQGGNRQVISLPPSHIFLPPAAFFALELHDLDKPRMLDR